MTALYVPARAGLNLFRWFSAAAFLAAVVSPVQAGEPITVRLDQATVINVPERAATIVIGDPLIADLSVQRSGLAVLTGKGFGSTNIIALDRSGAVLMEKDVEVKGPGDPIVVVYRGVARETYSCTPECLPRITLGDDPDYFTKTITESTTRNNAAVSAASQSGSGVAQDNSTSGSSRH
jgi:hypothetical protein